MVEENTKGQVILSGVNKHFTRQNGEKVVGLEDINLTIQPGEVVAVIGTNGAGKSTLFNVVAGTLMIDTGQIILGSVDATRLKSRQRAAKIGRVFQNPSMGTAPRMTVFENLMPASKRGEGRGFGHSLTLDNKQSVFDYLRTFKLDLENRLDVPIENLSGGQRQIISLVMATLKQPSLLLLDEHTAALDPRMARQVMTMTKEMIEEFSLTTLMITHHLQDALDYSDRIIVMHQGRIQCEFGQDEIPSLTNTKLFETLENLTVAEALKA